MKLEDLLHFLDDLLEPDDHPDYEGAHNGLQVEGPEEVGRLAVAVDASEATIDEAIRIDADLLLVHHGLFWGGGAPLTGRLYRRVAPLVRNTVGLYSSHLPLDSHPEVGNCAVLARELGVEPSERFGSYGGAPIGWRGALARPIGREELRRRVADVVGGEVRLIPGGPDEVRTVAVLTGGGGSFVGEAAGLVDALVTGEGSHHTYFDAVEGGVDVYYAGHYATETWGVRALASLVEERFGVEWTFIDHPTGL